MQHDKHFVAKSIHKLDMLTAVSPAQLRAARALIRWSQTDLALASNVSRPTIADFECGKRMPHDRTLVDLIAALERSGVEFTNDPPGVQLRNGRAPRAG
jgi:transcriptional regulator with XRE-family HTH domain